MLGGGQEGVGWKRRAEILVLSDFIVLVMTRMTSPEQALPPHLGVVAHAQYVARVHLTQSPSDAFISIAQVLRKHGSWTYTDESGSYRRVWPRGMTSLRCLGTDLQAQPFSSPSNGHPQPYRGLPSLSALRSCLAAPPTFTLFSDSAKNRPCHSSSLAFLAPPSRRVPALPPLSARAGPLSGRAGWSGHDALCGPPAGWDG